MDRAFKLSDIEKVETYLWVKEQLDLLEDFVRISDGEEEFGDLIDYLKEDNEYWRNDPLLEEISRGTIKLMG